MYIFVLKLFLYFYFLQQFRTKIAVKNQNSNNEYFTTEYFLFVQGCKLTNISHYRFCFSKNGQVIMSNS